MTERDIIGIFGKMNSGKSSLMNLLTQQETSIVDPTPGTTADTKIALAEIHGLGPVKIMDTAGYDELNVLGDKKRKKSIAALNECDLILLVVDPSTKSFEAERELMSAVHKLDKQLILIYNLFEKNDWILIPAIESILNKSAFYNKIELNATDSVFRQELLQSILKNYIPKNLTVELLPFVEPGEFYVLNIPMDEETPSGRYLRPQAMAEEYITRKWAFPVSYRMNLLKARNNDLSERKRWDDFLKSFKIKPRAIITDSQAIDIMKTWAPEHISLTTFSIMMINFMSRGKLNEFISGINAMNSLKAGDRILIAEACNHSRIKEDIGTVQIPRLIKAKYPEVHVDHVFGREFADISDIVNYKLVVHCGGCMISNQRMATRLRDLQAFGVAITNYGIFLSFMEGEETLQRVIKPWTEAESNF